MSVYPVDFNPIYLAPRQYTYTHRGQSVLSVVVNVCSSAYLRTWKQGGEERRGLGVRGV